MTCGPGEPFPRWVFLVIAALLGLFIWVAFQTVSSGAEEKKKALVNVAEKALTWGKQMEQRVEALEAELKELKERPDTVNKQVLSLKTVETVCHHGKRVWAIRFDKTDGTEGWFIAAKTEAWGVRFGDVRLQDCKGDEAVHPADRAKVLEEAQK